jgi:hypothetical protein
VLKKPRRFSYTWFQSRPASLGSMLRHHVQNVSPWRALTFAWLPAHSRPRRSRRSQYSRTICGSFAPARGHVQRSRPWLTSLAITPKASGDEDFGARSRSCRVGEDVATSPPQTRTCAIRASGSSRESFVPSGVAVSDPRQWQRMAVEKRSQAVPWEQLAARPTFPPFVPYRLDLMAILL